jgi:ethanolamine utilization cobalamin adenosyltransferase
LKIITESELRDQYKSEPFETYVIEAGIRLTPSAYEYLGERKIKILDPCGALAERSQHKREISINNDKPKTTFTLLESGESVSEKPEGYTHLFGTDLVRKDHARIKFRGKLDALESLMVYVISDITDETSKDIVDELNNILGYLGRMMRAEVLNEQLPFIDFNGWGEAEVNERSHHPMRYYGVKHFQAKPNHGKVIAGLNLLRSQVRQMEIVAVEAFYNEKGKYMERSDITLSLNRLSSILYIMMCRQMGGDISEA